SGEGNSRRTLVTLLVAGLLTVGLGFALARAWLPERHERRLPDRGPFVARFQQLMAQAGVRLEPDAPTVEIAVRDERLAALNASLDDAPVEARSAAGAGVIVKVTQSGALPGEPTPRDISVDLTPTLQPVSISCIVRDWKAFFRPGVTLQVPDATRLRLVRLLLLPGESVGAVQTAYSNTSPLFYYDTRESGSTAHVRVDQPGTGTVLTLTRGAQGAARAATQVTEAPLLRLLVYVLPRIVLILGVIALFAFLLFRRRIDLVNGGVLAAAALVLSLATFSTSGSASTLIFGNIFPAFFRTLWL